MAKAPVCLAGSKIGGTCQAKSTVRKRSVRQWIAFVQRRDASVTTSAAPCIRLSLEAATGRDPAVAQKARKLVTVDGTVRQIWPSISSTVFYWFFAQKCAGVVVPPWSLTLFDPRQPYRLPVQEPLRRSLLFIAITGCAWTALAVMVSWWWRKRLRDQESHDSPAFRAISTPERSSPTPLSPLFGGERAG
jgi:hypothetical protein